MHEEKSLLDSQLAMYRPPMIRSHCMHRHRRAMGDLVLVLEQAKSAQAALQAAAATHRAEASIRVSEPERQHLQPTAIPWGCEIEQLPPQNLVARGGGTREYFKRDPAKSRQPSLLLLLLMISPH